MVAVAALAIALAVLAGACGPDPSSAGPPTLTGAPENLASRSIPARTDGAASGEADRKAADTTPTTTVTPTPTPEPAAALFGDLDLPDTTETGDGGPTVVDGADDTTGAAAGEPAASGSDGADPTVVATPTPTPMPALPADPEERLATLAAEDAELTVTLLGPTGSGYEPIADHIEAGHHGTAFEVARQGAEVTAAVVWAIAWDVARTGEQRAADAWIDWALGTRNRTEEVMAGRDVQRLTEPGTPLNYVLAVEPGTALLIADVGGGDEVVAMLVARLGP